jgi:uncharacterized protein (TIGR03118 family)
MPVAILIGATGCGGSGSSGGTNVTTYPGAFVENKLVSDTAGVATVTDPNLKNPWGLSYAPNGAFWVSDNTTGLSTLYNGSGAVQGLVVTIPAAGGGSNGPVSGQVYNSTSDFALPSGQSSAFIFDSEDGLLTAWGGGTAASIVADRSATGAVYKGLAMGTNGGANFLYAANFNSGKVDVFDKTYTLTSSFTDPNIPAGFAPFGIANFGGLLYVTYAKQDAAKHDDVAGPGNGYVDVFQTNGTLVTRLVSKGFLNSPWGLAIAPSGFGNVGGALLVGNFGDGKINAFNLTTGQSMGTLKTKAGAAIVIPGLWGLMYGNGGGAGPTSTLYFTSGPNQEADGLMGSITVSP